MHHGRVILSCTSASEMAEGWVVSNAAFPKQLGLPEMPSIPSVAGLGPDVKPIPKKVQDISSRSGCGFPTGTWQLPVQNGPHGLFYKSRLDFFGKLFNPLVFSPALPSKRESLTRCCFSAWHAIAISPRLSAYLLLSKKPFREQIAERTGSLKPIFFGT
jgi:hypothetical protein